MVGVFCVRIYRGNSCVYIWGEIFVCVNVCVCVNFLCVKSLQKTHSETFFRYCPTKSLKIKEKMETVRLFTI